jgi:hypothetical protein
MAITITSNAQGSVILTTNSIGSSMVFTAPPNVPASFIFNLLGSNEDDIGRAITVDKNGNIYIVGQSGNVGHKTSTVGVIAKYDGFNYSLTWQRKLSS